MNRQELTALIRKKQSYLCVGLDPEKSKMPAHLRHEADAVFIFNKALIDATLPYAVAYKPNLAFYESMGMEGMSALKKTYDYLHTLRHEAFLIADAKRGDIGNTATQYARSLFDPGAAGFSFDAATVAPYMGSDSVKPFLAFEGKWAIVLALTSNPGASDFQEKYIEAGCCGSIPVFEEVIRTACSWGSPDNIMFVAGATRPEMLGRIRKLVPLHFLLVPGVGSQGGSLNEVSEQAFNDDCGILVNVSRNIIYASGNDDYATKAGLAAREIQGEMKKFLFRHKII
jgi:orotidine-5'-phosphate decarboxylase